MSECRGKIGAILCTCPELRELANTLLLPLLSQLLFKFLEAERYSHGVFWRVLQLYVMNRKLLLGLDEFKAIAVTSIPT